MGGCEVFFGSCCCCIISILQCKRNKVRNKPILVFILRMIKSMYSVHSLLTKEYTFNRERYRVSVTEDNHMFCYVCFSSNVPSYKSNVYIGTLR